MTAFTDLFRSLLHQRGLSQRKLAQMAEPSRSIGGSAASISLTLNEKVPPPLHTVPLWADALELEGEERERFFALADIAHLPEESQPRWVDRLDELYSLRKKLSAIVIDLHRAAEEEPGYDTEGGG